MSALFWNWVFCVFLSLRLSRVLCVTPSFPLNLRFLLSFYFLSSTCFRTTSFTSSIQVRPHLKKWHANVSHFHLKQSHFIIGVFKHNHPSLLWLVSHNTQNLHLFDVFSYGDTNTISIWLNNSCKRDYRMCTENHYDQNQALLLWLRVHYFVPLHYVNQMFSKGVANLLYIVHPSFPHQHMVPCVIGPYGFVLIPNMSLKLYI